MTKTLRNLVCGGMLALASVLPLKEAKSQINGNIQYIQHQDNPESYVRTFAFYTLPGEIEGFGIGEFYKGGDGYFGVNFLEKETGKGINLRARIESDNEPFTQGSIGARIAIPNLPKGASAKIHWDALWIDKNGKYVPNRSVLGYFVSADLPLGFDFSTLGEFHVAKPEGVTWKYGEIDVGRNIGPVRVSYNPALNSIEDGKLSPKFEHRLNVSASF